MIEKRSPAVEGWENRLRIFQWVIDNPCHNQGECAAALGLHRRTVGKHWEHIKAGWRPPVGRSPNRFFSGVTSQDQAIKQADRDREGKA